MARARLHGEDLAGPTLVDVEVTSVPRGRVRGVLLNRIWELRDNLTVYDAAYVALAEILGAPLVTADGKLAKATGPECRVELLT